MKDYVISWDDENDIPQCSRKLYRAPSAEEAIQAYLKVTGSKRRAEDLYAFEHRNWLGEVETGPFGAPWEQPS